MPDDRIDGSDRIDADPPRPVPGTPGGWLDPFDDHGWDARAVRIEMQRQQDQLRRAILAAREEAAAETRHIA